jgi:hypothetical protein
MEHKHRVGYFRHSFSRPELHIFVACGNSRVLDDHFSIRERFATKKKGHFQFLVAQPEQAGFGPSANKEGRD